MRGWSISNILPPGHTANSYNLKTNCGYCTAAALQNMTCDALVTQTGLMQYDTNNFSDFSDLFPNQISHKTYDVLQHVINDLLTRLPYHLAVAFAYRRVNESGHMIVVFKSKTLIGATGDIARQGWGYLRHIDYQLPNPQPADGILPANENIAALNKFALFWPQ